MPKKKSQKFKYSPAVEPNSTMRNKTGSWRTFIPCFDHEKCKACGICEQVCPEGVCHKVKGKNYYDFDPEYCKGCGVCAAECPFKAITMKLEEK